jgi:serine/threonine protein kinase, bacterial
VEYAYGHTKPSRTISGQGLYEAFGLAVDKNDNLYIADPAAAGIFELKHGTAKVINLGLQGIYSPYGVAVDQTTGYLWGADGGSNGIDVYKPGTKTPIHEIHGGGFPYAISIQNDGKQDGPVVVADIHLNVVYAFRARTYGTYAIETNGIEEPSGVLVQMP